MKLFTSVFRDNARYRAFFASILMAGLGYGIYKGIIDNYLAEVAHMGEFGRGVAEFFRELPGLLLVLILAVFYMLSAETLYKLGAIVMLGGMAMLTFVSPTQVMVTIAICIYSLGEHIQLGMKSTLTLGYARQKAGGRALGIQGSVQQIGTLAGYLVIVFAFSAISGGSAYRVFFAAATVITAIAMLFSFGVAGKSATDKNKSRFYFRKKFKKYYMLEIFYGARKQVFFTFGPYVLILFYGANAARISLLYAVSSVACFILSPVVGKIIDKLGYKPVMILDTVLLVGVCFFYGFAHRIFPMDVAYTICCINYILDSVISLASMASSVYVQDIASDQDEVRATLSTGISVNHMITILIALFGGWIWQTLGMETLFIVSAVLGLCNSAYAATVHPREERLAAGKQET